jgi:hypothetical protein
MATNQKFLKDLAKEINQAQDSFDTRLKGISKAINESLIGPVSSLITPKDTGHLRNNWVVSIDQEYLDVSGSRENPNNSKQEANWRVLIAKKDLYLSNNIYFNNNVYYGPWVNDGNDRMPERNFRKAAIQAGDETAKLLRKSKG